MTTKAMPNKLLMFSPHDVRSASSQTILNSGLCGLEKHSFVLQHLLCMLGLWCEVLWFVFGRWALVFCELYLRYHSLKLWLVKDQLAAWLQKMIALTLSPTQLCWRDLITHEWCHAIINGYNSIVGKLYRGNCFITLHNRVIIVFVSHHVLPFVLVCTGAQQNQPILNSHQQTGQLSRCYSVWGDSMITL